MLKRIITLTGRICAPLLWRPAALLKSVAGAFRCGWWQARLHADGLTIKRPNAITGISRIHIGRDCAIGRLAVISAWEEIHGQRFSPEICLGDGVRLGDYIHITAVDSIRIGDGTLTGRWVTITDNSHGHVERGEMATPPDSRPVVGKGAVEIGRNVWIGDKVTVLPGVRIGEGAVIGANSVVARDVPPFCVAAGIPAKVIRELR